ncbi:uncharacterized protein LOC143453287 [Clavelina lepadiformis]|uniref:uncharacterized protein LOC143453287 n=1 Tax=Clavelina lepadiformis TaxID=159417 RepID=UPI0040423C04
MSDRPNMNAVMDFDKNSLKKTETCVKSGVVEGYSQEKALQEVTAFKKENLQHVQTEEKTKLPTKDDIELEKKSGF